MLYCKSLNIIRTAHIKRTIVNDKACFSFVFFALLIRIRRSLLTAHALSGQRINLLSIAFNDAGADGNRRITILISTENNFKRSAVGTRFTG